MSAWREEQLPGRRVRAGDGIVTNLHDCAVVPQCHGNTFLVFKCDAPHSLSLSDKLAHEVASLQIPNLDPAVATAANDTCIIKL